jgi:hypothetical protein
LKEGYSKILILKPQEVLDDKSKNTIEDEVDAIRLELYDETKYLTNEDLVAYIRKETASICKQFGFKTIPGIDEFINTKLQEG